MSEKELKEIEKQVETRYDKKMKQREALKAKEKKEKKVMGIITLVVVLACIIGVGALFVNRYQQTNGTYIVVDGEEISKATFDYYFQVGFSNYQNMYGTYIGYLGLDVTKDLYAQEYSEDMSWGDFFEQLAVDYIVESKSLTNEAKAAGFEYDVEEEYNAFVKSVEEQAAEAGVSPADYYKAAYGDYATKNSVRPMIEESILYSAYYNEKYNSFDPTEEEVEAYYNENKSEYDTVGYNLYTMAAEYETVEGQQVPEETLTAAMKVAEDKANEFVEKVKSGEEFYVVANEYAAEDAEEADAESVYTESVSTINVNGAYSTWLFEDGRKDGDLTVAVDEINNRYFIVEYKDRYLDQIKSANVRFIQTTTMDGQVIVDEFNTAGGTEEAFIELVNKYSEGDTSNGGLIEKITTKSVLEDIQEWIFAEGRATSDVTSIVAANGNTYVLYYVGEGIEQWKVTIENELISDLMYEYVEGIKANIKVEDPKGHLKYLQIEETADGDSADDNAEVDTTEE